jgi:hypothetical protein
VRNHEHHNLFICTSYHTAFALWFDTFCVFVCQRPPCPETKIAPFGGGCNERLRASLALRPIRSCSGECRLFRHVEGVYAP